MIFAHLGRMSDAGNDNPREWDRPARALSLNASKRPASRPSRNGVGMIASQTMSARSPSEGSLLRLTRKVLNLRLGCFFDLEAGEGIQPWPLPRFESLELVPQAHGRVGGSTHLSPQGESSRPARPARCSTRESRRQGAGLLRQPSRSHPRIDRTSSSEPSWTAKAR